MPTTSLKPQFKNTYEFGQMTILVIPEGKSYTGVCLEFDLVVKAPTREKAKEHIEELAYSWLENIKKNKLSEKLLNKRAPEKYWRISEAIDKMREARRTLSRKEIKPTQQISQSDFIFSIWQNLLGSNHGFQQ